MKPVLTIVVPVYNTEQYLEKCLDSLLIPQLDKLEIIVVIDGSPDNSLELAKKYAHRYPDTFKVIDKENGGHGSCCNVGLKLATGKYIRFLDSDDWLDTDTLSILIDKLNVVDVDVVLTRSVKEMVYNGSVERYGFPYEENACDKILSVEAIDFHLSDEPFLTLAACSFRTDLLLKTNIHFSEKTSFDDTIIYTNPFIGVHKILLLDLVLYHYYIGRPEQSVLNISPAKHCQIFNETFKAVREFPKIPYDLYLKSKAQFSHMEARLLLSLYFINARTAINGRRERRLQINEYIDNHCRTDKAKGLKFLILKHIASPMVYRIYTKLSKFIKK